MFSQKIQLCQEMQHLINQERTYRDEERDNFRKSLQDIESQLDLVNEESAQKIKLLEKEKRDAQIDYEKIISELRLRIERVDAQAGMRERQFKKQQVRLEET
jgi:tetrahydromethanopterin S-methyltransferase subunit G